MVPLFLVLLAAAAVYVGVVQAAFTSLMRLSLRLIAERDGRAGIGRYLDEPVLLFLPTRILLGVILILATYLVSRLIGVTGVSTAAPVVLLAAAFAIVFEHAVPAAIVRRNPEAVLEALLPSFEYVVTALGPLTLPLSRLFTTAGRRDRSIGVVNGEPVSVEPGDATGPSTEAGDEDLTEKDERRLLKSIVDFGDTLVREVMTPRPDIVAIRSDATLEELRALFREQEYSRMPVYKDNLDNILGFVFIKDLIRLPPEGASDKPIASLLRPSHVVPETKRVSGLLNEFQRRQVQIAIVVDEYGGTAGLVTIEDLLEEIVGEIRDEYDVETEPIVDEGDGRFVVSGKVDIDQIAGRLDVRIEREGFETFGGYLLSHLGRVPTVGETIEIDSLVVEVLEAERRRVTKVRIHRQHPVEEPAPVGEEPQ
jgi:CBS domain containing-hemolysin-like protein